MKRKSLLPIFIVFLLALILPLVVMARIALAAPTALPGQVGPSIQYTTATGTTATRYYVYAGSPNDDYHYAQVVVPDSLDVNSPTPVVLAIHGATATEEQIFTNAGVNLMLDSWLDRGWPVIATREGETVTLNANGVLVGKNGKWGNQASSAGMADAWPWLQTWMTPDSHGMLVYGWSMGGTGALNFTREAQRRGYPVAAVNIIDGATNLRYDYTNSTSFAKNIRTAYGLPTGTIAGDPNWVNLVDMADGGHDPQVMAQTLTPVPLRMSGSVSDATVNKANNSLLLHTTLQNLGTWNKELSYWSYSGGHCAKSHYKPSDANAFFDRALSL